MQHVGTAELAAAVCRAGGLGVVTALTQPTPELLRAEIRRTRALVGESVPFAVNLAILPMLIPADYSAYVDVICEERVAAIEISAGSPRKFMPRLRAAGVKVIHKVRARAAMRLPRSCRFGCTRRKGCALACACCATRAMHCRLASANGRSCWARPRTARWPRLRTLSRRRPLAWTLSRSLASRRASPATPSATSWARGCSSPRRSPSCARRWW